LGFVFDGYTAYTDLRQNADSDLRDLATLYVYEDPVIETFKESNGNEVLVSVVYSREGRTPVMAHFLKILTWVKVLITYKMYEITQLLECS